MQGASRPCRPSLEREHHVATDKRAAPVWGPGYVRNLYPLQFCREPKTALRPVL